jgi:hypothetical protein
VSDRIRVGIDPGNDYLGLAVYRLGADPDLECHGIRVGGKPGKVFRDVLVPKLEPLARHGATLVIERPPEKVRRDVNHGAQAPIGYALGYVSGMVAGLWHQHGAPVHRVTVRDWRTSMGVFNARRGLVLTEPGAKGERERWRAMGLQATRPSQVADVKRVDGGWTVRYRCGHKATFDKYDALTTRGGECQECQRALRPAMTRAEAVTDAWKLRACQGIKEHWPEEYERIVSAARKRAKTNKADHRLAGVPDACEAAWVALHAEVAEL